MIRPLKNAGFNRNEARRLGFRVSEILWDTCDDSSDRNIGNNCYLLKKFLKFSFDFILF